MGNEFRRDNHFVPRSYLKRWSGPDGKVSVYRLLVSDQQVPLWKRAWPKGLARLEHLYTSSARGVESDALERWLDSEFEAPAEEPITKAIHGKRLSKADWRILVRFLACQDARTPARFEQHFRRHEEQMPQLIEASLESAMRKRKEILERGESLPQAPPDAEESSFPFRVSVVPNPDGEGGHIVGEALNGRELWLLGIRRALTVPIRHLLTQRWTILRPPDGESFLTSDSPVLRLGFSKDGSYSLDGGWGVPGTDIMLPLGPNHALYTQVDRPVPRRDTQVAPALFQLLKRFTVENAYRQVVAYEDDPAVALLRPRTVDKDMVKAERSRWANWHRENAAAEAELRFDSGPTRE